MSRRLVASLAALTFAATFAGCTSIQEALSGGLNGLHDALTGGGACKGALEVTERWNHRFDARALGERLTTRGFTWHPGEGAFRGSFTGKGVDGRVDVVLGESVDVTEIHVSGGEARDVRPVASEVAGIVNQTFSESSPKIVTWSAEGAGARC